MHPYDVSFYDKDNSLFPKLKRELEEMGGSFHTYGEVSNHFNN